MLIFKMWINIQVQYLTGLLLGTGEWCLGDFTADGYRTTEWEISRFCFESVKTCLLCQKNDIASAKIFNDLDSFFFFACGNEYEIVFL